MSLCNRRTLILGGAALFGTALSGCGFAPAYGPGGAATKLQDSILADEPSDRAGFIFVRRLEERLGRGAPARYGLSYSIDFEERALAINAANVTARINVIGQLTYALRDLETDKVLSSGKVDSFTSYSATGTTVATSAAKRNAEERLLTILTDQLVTRLTADAARLPA
jgi:LPS-assembly lipoprotein